MRITSTLLLGSIVVCCGTIPTRGKSHSQSVMTFRGPPDVRIRTPGTLLLSDLETGLPSMRIEGPGDIVYRFSIVDDVDGDGRPSVGEERVGIPLTRSNGGFVVTGARLEAEFRARFSRPMVAFEFLLNGKGQLYTQAIQ